MGNKRLIDSRELSRILKDYFKALISAGKDLVDINDPNADIHKIMDMMPSEEGIEWYDAEWQGCLGRRGLSPLNLWKTLKSLPQAHSPRRHSRRAIKRMKQT